MFYAAVMVSMLGVPKIFYDTRGPYETRGKCEQRLEEMEQFTLTDPRIVFLRGECRQSTNEQVL